MREGQTLVADDGHQVALFPISVMYITQGEYGSLSHDLAMDFVGWSDQQGQIYHFPYYAPCDMQCVDKSVSQAWLVWQSTDVVWMPDGSLDYLTMVVMHDDAPIYNVGDRVSQGQLLGRSGSSGYATGDHIHINTAKGTYAGWSPTQHGGFNELTNSMHLYDALFINDTYITSEALTYGYDWKEFQGGHPEPPERKKEIKKFKWVLYANKIRNRKKFY